MSRGRKGKRRNSGPAINGHLDQKRQERELEMAMMEQERARRQQQQRDANATAFLQTSAMGLYRTMVEKVLHEEGLQSMSLARLHVMADIAVQLSLPLASRAGVTPKLVPSEGMTGNERWVVAPASYDQLYPFGGYQDGSELPPELVNVFEEKGEAETPQPEQDEEPEQDEDEEMDDESEPSSDTIIIP